MALQCKRCLGRGCEECNNLGFHSDYVVTEDVGSPHGSRTVRYKLPTSCGKCKGPVINGWCPCGNYHTGKSLFDQNDMFK